MKNLKRLGISLALVCILATVAFADGSPCAPPEPGTVNSPPCAAAQITSDDSVAQSPPASNAGDAASVAELAVDLLQSVLSLF